MNSKIRDFFKQSTTKTSDSKGKNPQDNPDPKTPKKEEQTESTSRTRGRSKSVNKADEKSSQHTQKSNKKEKEEEKKNDPKTRSSKTPQKSKVEIIPKKNMKEDVEMKDETEVKVANKSDKKQQAKSNHKKNSRKPTPQKKGQKKSGRSQNKKKGRKDESEDEASDYESEESFKDESEDNESEGDYDFDDDEEEKIVKKGKGTANKSRKSRKPAIEESDEEVIAPSRNTRSQQQQRQKRVVIDNDEESEVEVKRRPNKSHFIDEDEDNEEEKVQQKQQAKQEPNRRSQMDEYLQKMASQQKKTGISPMLKDLNIEEESSQEVIKPQRKSTRQQQSKTPQVKMEDEEDEDDEARELKSALDGLTFVISGEFESISRPRLEEFIKNHGGRLTSAVSGKTNYLIVGYKLEDGRDVTQGSKYHKASQLGKTILTEKEFEDFVRKRIGNPEFTLSTRKSIVDQVKQQQDQTIKRNSTIKEENFSHEMWTDLYKPMGVSDLVGNEGVVDQLLEWLKDWDDVNIRGKKKQVFFRPGMSWQNVPNVNAKAALLSGPPGIGKTSAARIVCQELGYEVLETNASETRNKNSINNVLKDLSSNQSLDYFSVAGLKRQQTVTNPFAQDQGLQTKKSVIIMDEVDGVGAGDRGGIQALIQIIKQTQTPIICICNDRMNRKLQSLVNYCYDLKFQRPSKEAIMRRIKLICQDQKLDIDPETLDRIVESSGNDIRQIVNILQMWKNHNLDKGFVKNIQKDELVMINNFDAAHRLLNHGAKSLNQNYPSFRQKVDLFFIDYELIPLLVQENYLTAMGDRKTLEDIEKMADASEFISLGDAASRQLRKNQDWSLLPNMGFASSIAPCLIIEGSTFYPRFPEWLGKNSSQRKSKRLIRELKKVMGHHAMASRMDIQNEYVQLLLLYIYKCLKKGKAHVQDALEFMADLGLTNEHLKEHLMTLSMDSKIVENFESLDTQIKSAFTKEYNKQHKDETIGKKGAKKGKGKAPAASNEEEEDDEEIGNSQLLDEEQINEIKKGRKLEKQEEEKGKLEKTDKFEILKVKEAGGTAKKGRGKGTKGTKSTKGSARKGAKKKITRGKKESDDEDMASDDSLNDFIADDDEIEYDKKKKKSGKKGRK